jgi:hypothetical protein
LAAGLAPARGPVHVVLPLFVLRRDGFPIIKKFDKYDISVYLDHSIGMEAP